MLSAAQIRQQFLDFFQSKGHVIVPSAPIVVKNDPTLLFTNAGMNQFKDYFLGNAQPQHTRVADTQKCLRVSGKHNDLEEVGVDTYHHTMFEMLGNWSFGDYFKSEAIAWSWELLTKVYGIDKDKLYVTIFEGDEKEGLPRDTEAYDEWKKWIAEDRILLGNKKDNFWEMGDTGPCGPCTEIHVDGRSAAERAQVPGDTLVNADHPQVIEIWNNVFIQFNRMKDGSLQPLPARHVDTGMGFERLVRVLQGKTSNYDTDVFTGTIQKVAAITAQQYEFGDSKKDIAFRVLADHIRAISFTIADGQLPASTGAGYVIRRILRRAVRYYYTYLNYKQPLLFQLVPVIGQQFEHVFPELKKQEAFVSKVIREEEDAFLRTLEKGLKRIDDIIANAKDGMLDGKSSFELYDTYGFPIDLTRLIASEQNFSIDEKGFAEEMAQQKNRSRAATTIDTEDWVKVNEDEAVQFVGYDDLNITTKVLRYRKIKVKGKEQYQIVLASTPFYAESGGQVGDTGTLHFGEEVIAVTDTKKENDLIIHFTDRLPENINTEVRAIVNLDKRLSTMYNHTGTHLLHAALRQVLGTHVAQKGSLVSPDVLRFDISHFAKITDEELASILQIVNKKIRENIAVNIQELPKEEAMQSGAMALFGEKYGDKVRVVTIDPEFSIELCGGTHVPQTGMIGSMIITSEAAVAAGVRRIEALTGPAALHYVVERLQSQKHVTELLKSKDPLKAIEKLLSDKSALEKKVEMMEARQLVSIRQELMKNVQAVNGVSYIGASIEVPSVDGLRRLGNDFKNELKTFVVALVANIDGKASVAISISDDLVKDKNWDASKMIKDIATPLIKGGGGGNKTLAVAGGQDTTQLKKVLDNVLQFINN